MSRLPVHQQLGPKRPPADPSRTPRWLRPKLTSETKRELSLAHHANLDAIARGDAAPEVMWGWAGGCLTWSAVAQALKRGEEQMAKQLELVERVITNFERTGSVSFPSDGDYQLAVEGVVIMDLLAEATDCYTAGLAANWSDAAINARASGNAEAAQ